MDQTLTPLEDPAYQPAHVPINGRPPDVVAKWGPRSQLRWFHRFYPELYVTLRGQKFEGMLDAKIAGNFYCHSLQHKGPCCSSCIEDAEYDPIYDMYPVCCCRSEYSVLDEDKIPRL